MKSSQWPRGELNRPLMKPGETYEIMAVVFNDKSYEGDEDDGKWLSGVRRKYRAWLARL